MNRPMTRIFLLAGLVAIVGTVAGCGGDDSRAAELARGALGVKDSKAETSPRRVVYRMTEEIIDPETGKVLESVVEERPVTVQVEIERDVKVDTGESHTAAHTTAAPSAD